MTVLADDEVVVYRNPKRRGDVDDGFSHTDIGLRRVA